MEAIGEVSRLCSPTRALQRKLEFGVFHTKSSSKEWLHNGQRVVFFWEFWVHGSSKSVPGSYEWDRFETKISFYENWLGSILNDPIRFQFC